MDYYQISMPNPADPEQTDILIAQLSALGVESFEEQEAHLLGYISFDEFDKDILLTNNYIAKCDSEGSLLIDVIEDKNWNEVWESNYPPVKVGKRCYVRAPFHDQDHSFDYEIIIKPKMAFGTGHHQTTSMILEYILDMDIKGKRVLDMGCGSGVLAILASMRGASDLVAIDIDHWSYENTMENCEVNNISNIRAFLGGAELLSEHKDFEVVFANINKNILLRDMKSYSQSLLVGGTLITSGYYNSDLKDIIDCASEYGLEFTGNKIMDNWVAGEFRKTK